MATPIQPKDTQAGCNPVSSNCVIWQGPDIPCITLCKGDSISDVTYKVATELCTLVDQLDITGFDVSCFPPICPKPENIHDLIQFIIDTLCAQQGNSGTGTSFNCDNAINCLVPVVPCFQKTDAYGDLVVQLSIQDYATAIATEVCLIIDQIVDIKADITDLQTRVEILEDCVLPCTAPSVTIEIPTSCLSTNTNIPIETFVEDLETAFCALQTATGNPGQIASAIAQECINLDTTPTLNNSTVTYNALPGWVNAGSYINMADAINNMWITICDMRNAVQGMLNTCCSTSCDGVSITMTSAYTNPNIELAFTGSALGFSDCYLDGMYVTITDAYGVSYTTQVSVIPNLGGVAQSIDLSVSLLNLYTDYTVSLIVCATDGTITCNNAIIQTVSNSALCPTITYEPKDESIPYEFTNPLSSPVTYILECYDNTLTSLVVSNTIVNPAVGLVTGALTGLTLGVTYQVRIRTIIGSTIKDCPYESLTTTL